MLDRLCVFPVKGEPSDGGNNDMTLRDYFAAKAMQSLMPKLAPEDLCMEDIASFAYFMADHMIEERERDDTNA